MLVLPHAVQLEAARPAEQEPAAVGRVGAGLGEQALELDEPRVDEERAASSFERHLRALQPEWVLDHRPRTLERIAAARQRAQDVTRVEATLAAPKRRPPLAQPADVLDHDHRGRRHAALVLEHEVDAEIVALQVVAVAGAADEPHRLRREPHPRPREQDGEQEAGRDRVEGFRAERPGGGVRGDAEAKREAALPGHFRGTACGADVRTRGFPRESV